MFGIFDKLTEFFKDMLLGGIKANLESMFLDINEDESDLESCRPQRKGSVERDDTTTDASYTNQLQ